MYSVLSKRADSEGTIESPVVDIRQLAAYLDVSARHVEELNKRALIPAPIALGRLRKWMRSEIDAWLLAGAPPREAWERIRQSRMNVESMAQEPAQAVLQEQ